MAQDGDDSRLLPPTFDPWQSLSPDRDVAVMMSGGVDSSVAALLLRQAGWRVLGITMRIPAVEACSNVAPCCGAEAALVCHELGIPHYYVDVKAAFVRRVITPFRRAYEQGRTPNPCVNCNTFLKFRIVWDLLEEELGIRRVATGHYGDVFVREGVSCLRQPADKHKDQTYFLYGIPQARLSDFMLPLAPMRKADVRDVAESHGLTAARRPDSMGLCFTGESDYRQGLGGMPDQAGPVVDAQGNILGQHRGVWNYTVGQRRGLGIAAEHPLYVIRIHVTTNTVVLGRREEAERHVVPAARTNVLLPGLLIPGATLAGRIRSSSPLAPCRVLEVSADSFSVEFRNPIFAPVSGQHLVLYDADGVVVAGGEIRAADES